jgi:hypothetical protein
MPKYIRVFISSTSKDLKKDIRSLAIEVIDRSDYAKPVAMERWVEDNDYSEDICLRKLEDESTHFLGIFAHRYGWRPNGPTDVSITEKEYDHAVKLGRKRLILSPKEDSDIYSELWQRAEDQTDEDKSAQKAFVSRVSDSGRYVRYFENLQDLGYWVKDKIDEWTGVKNGFRETAATAKAASVAPPRDSLSTLGRIEQLRKFEDSLRDHVALTTPEVACFLIHGKAGFGHEETLDRLQKRLCEDREVFPIRVDAGAAWRGKDAQALLEVLGEEIEERLDSVESLAGRLKTEMTRLDVVIRFDNLQRLNISLADFVESFWKPLAKSFGEDDADLSQRLIGLAGYKRSLGADCDSHILRLDGGEEFDNTKLIALPELADFTEKDLLVWLKQQKMPPAKAKDLASKLILETGGNPPALFQELMKDSIWKG